MACSHPVRLQLLLFCAICIGFQSCAQGTKLVLNTAAKEAVTAALNETLPQGLLDATAPVDAELKAIINETLFEIGHVLEGKKKLDLKLNLNKIKHQTTPTPMVTLPPPTSIPVTVTPSGTSTPPPSSTSTPPVTTSLASSTPLPATSSMPSSTTPDNPASTPAPTSTTGSTRTPVLTCHDVLGPNICNSVEAGPISTNVDLCSDPVTCACNLTSVDTVCTGTNGLCFSTPSDYSQCGLFQACKAAPINLGFEEFTTPNLGNPFTYDGLSFSATNVANGVNINAFNRIVTPSTQSFAEIRSGAAALESNYEPSPSIVTTEQTLVATDGNIANGGAYVAVSAYINGENFNGQSIAITVSGKRATVAQPDCQSNIATFPGFPGGNPIRVFFAGLAAGPCIVDTLTLLTTNVSPGTTASSLKISLDDFVVCKANSASALEGALPG